MTTRWKSISKPSRQALSVSGTAGLYHGGDVAAAKRRFHLPNADWLDLSTGINAMTYPFAPPAREAWARLPDGASQARLLDAAAAYYGVRNRDCVVPAPGSQALIQLLPHMRAPSKVAVLGPTYGEHESRWAAGGHDVVMVEALSDVPAEANIVVLCNPNNPDGRILDKPRLSKLARSLSERDGWLIVDEAFADLEPHTSLADTVVDGGIVVLRSFGKFFGLAGLRLGFALAEPSLAARLSDRLGPWAVSGPAAEIGAAALADTRWIEHARQDLMVRAARLDACLARARLNVVGGTSLFRLVEAPRAAALYDHLGSHAILVRHFPERADWLRFGVPATDADLNRLGDALSEPMAA